MATFPPKFISLYNRPIPFKGGGCRIGIVVRTTDNTTPDDELGQQLSDRWFPIVQAYEAENDGENRIHVQRVKDGNPDDGEDEEGKRYMLSMTTPPAGDTLLQTNPREIYRIFEKTLEEFEFDLISFEYTGEEFE